MKEISTIIFECSKLDKNVWAKIYSNIHAIENHNVENIPPITDNLIIHLFPNSSNIKRIILPGGLKISESNLEHIRSIQKQDYLIYFNKDDSVKNFSELLPFFNLIDEYKSRISLCININEIKVRRDRDEYSFSISQFLNFYRMNKNIRNGEQIYFAYDYELIDDKTGEKGVQNTARLAEYKEYSKNVSKEFSPLIKVDPQIKELLFTANSQYQVNKRKKSIVIKYLVEDIKKYNSEIEKYIGKIKRKKSPSSYELNQLKNFQAISSYDYKNYFSEYFIKGLIYHLIEIKEVGKVKDFYSTIYLMEKYGDGIEEIIENIVFHTHNKVGYFFFTYQNTSEISLKNYKESLVNTVLNINRNLEIYISDFSEKGILDTFSISDKLDDLFDPHKIPNEFSHLDLRYAAHLGLKIFHKNIISSYGYYRVETLHKKSNSNLTYIRSFDSKTPESFSEKANNINGTHYNIILPISDKIVKNIPSDSLVTYQSEPLKYTDWLFNKTDSIQYIHLNQFEINNARSKEEQLKIIESIGNKVIKLRVSQKSIAFNYYTMGIFSEPQIFFRLIAYLQLKAESFINIIIVTELPVFFIKKIDDLLRDFLIETNKIWNKHTAVVLITQYLFPYILNGETKEEITKVNQQLRLHYPRRDDFFKYSKVNNDLLYNYKNKFIQPYELLVYEKFDNLFESYVSKILDNNIEDEKIGFKLLCENVLLGSKIIVKNFYEADTLFQNSFFVDRFAFLIAQQIIELDPTKEIILIGYGLYSEFLSNTIKEFIAKSKKIRCVAVVIAKNLDKDDWIFRGISLKDITENFDNYSYVTIVPIGSTLTTNDKVIAKFQQFLNLKNKISENFFYNVSVILVRDNSTEISKKNITEKEKEYWEEITDKLVKTKFRNAKSINYLVEKDGYWFIPFESISFPEDFSDERPVLKTKNLSVNSVRAIGWPKVKNITERDFKDELKKLESFRKFTSIGHFNWNNTHLHYYFDTESFITENKGELCRWLKQISNDHFTGLNVILTPNNNMESTFVKLINQIVFNKNAFIIYIDIYSDIRDNLKHKYSFLKKIEEDNSSIRFHFVDHVLSTGESTRKARSYISSILDKNKNFSSIITIINRLSFERNNELEGYNREKTIINEYFNLFIPPIKSPEKDCSICQIVKRYEELNGLSAIDSLSSWLDNKIKKLEEIEFNVSNKTFIDRSNKFDRIILTHKIFYTISAMLFQKKSSSKDILNYLNELGSNDDISFKINFVKVLSTQPLSNYQHIKNFIFRYMLNELYQILSLTDEDNYQIDKFNYLIVLLKHLSEYDSNSLVRKELMQKVWAYYFNFSNFNDIDKVIGQINMEIENKRTKTKLFNNDLFDSNNSDQKINELSERLRIVKKAKRNFENFNIIFHLFIYNVISNSETSAVWLGDLLRTGEEKLIPHEIIISGTITNNNTFTFFDKSDLNEKLVSKYKNFLVWLFFDNTIIIRNTIDRFESEIDRNKDLRDKFYLNTKSNEIKSFENFIVNRNIDEVVLIFKEVIECEYYHKYIRLYLEVTKPPILYKLILSVYAKLLFKQILKSENVTKQLGNKIKSILEIYSKIMDADSAFLALEKPTKNNSLEKPIKNKYRVLSTFNFEDNTMKDSLHNINDQFYTVHILENEDNIYPITSNDSLKLKKENEIFYKEKNIFNIQALNVHKFFINNKLRGAITFLYKESFKNFHTYSKELSRFFLTLNKQLNNFLEIAYNKHSINDLITSMDNLDKFDRIYTDSDHHFSESTRKSIKSVYKISKNHPEEKINLLSPLLTFADSTISWLYSKVEKHNGDISVLYGDLIDDENTFISVFNTEYLEFLELLNSEVEKWRGQLSIQGFDIEGNFEIIWDSEILRSFILLLLKNAMYSHLPMNTKKIDLIYSRESNSIKIINNFPEKEKGLQQSLAKKKDEFHIKKIAIEKLIVEDYSCTTLTSLKSYCNLLGLTLEFGFDAEDNFFVQFNLS